MSERDDRLEEAVTRFVSQWFEGQEPEPEAFCADYPEDEKELRLRIDDFLNVSDAFEECRAPAERDTTERQHEVLGPYRILREIGRGGMGVVYEAEDTRTGRPVALKVLPSHLTLHPEAIARFIRESNTAAELDHPGIIRVYERGERDGTHYFAMEYVEGQSIADWLESVRHQRAEEVEPSWVQNVAGHGERSYCHEVCRLVRQVAEALHIAHRRGVIHRDVKPSNILVRKQDAQAVLTDFGLARHEAHPSLSATGDFAGTPHYVSPEQAMARRVEVDHRTDIYSLGVTLYELLTLRRPFEGESAREILGKIIAKEPRTPHELNPSLSPALGTVVLKAIDKDPDRRYATARDFGDDLDNILTSKPIRATPLPFVVRAWRRARREPWRASLYTSLVVFGIVSAILFAIISGQSQKVTLAEGIEHARRLENGLVDGFRELSKGSLSKAKLNFDAVLDLDPRNAEALIGAAMVASRLQGPYRALREFEARLEAGSPDSVLDRIRIHLLEECGRDDEVRSLSSSLGPPTTPLEYFVEAVRELGHCETADPETIELVHALSSRAVLGHSSARPLYHFQLAHAVRHLGDAQRAQEMADGLRTLWPDSATSWFWRGLLLHDHAPADSTDAYRRALEIDPDLAMAHNALGTALFRDGHRDEARQSFDRALSLDPEFAVVFYNLGVIATMEGDLDDAVHQLRQAVEIDPLMVRGLVNLGNVFQRRGDYEEARESFMAALDLQPEMGLIYGNLGNLSVREGDREEAREYFDMALELDPTLGRVHAALGNLAREEGDLEHAIECYEKAIEYEPSFAPAQRNLSQALRELGRE